MYHPVHALTVALLFVGAVLWFKEPAALNIASNIENIRHQQDEGVFVAGIQDNVFVTGENATSIFGAVHNALRQKGSDLNPVGLSMFPAKIPAGTMLYHSTNEYFPSSPEWVAMDPEFSYNFANRGEGDHTFLTFRAVKDLDKILVLDGASASKDNTGEMDTQVLLAGGTKEQYTNFTFLSERVGAKKICDWGKSFGLDGIVRLETGFEVIICDFHSPKIELWRRGVYHSVPKFTGLDLSSIGGDMDDIFTGTSAYDHLKAGASHYESETRIQIDFSHMVTPINRTYISPNTYTRRLTDVSDDIKEGLRVDVARALEQPVNPNYGTNWQEVSDRLTTKFADTLVYINKTFTKFLEPNSTITVEQTVANISAYPIHTLVRFSNVTTDKSTTQREDAIKEFVVEYSAGFIKTPVDALIQASISEIARLVAVELYDLQDFALDILRKYYNDNIDTNVPEYADKLREHAERFKQFLDFLNWSEFYRCKEACGWNEVCYVPLWGPSPMGFKFHRGGGSVHTTRYSYNDLYCAGVHEILNHKNQGPHTPNFPYGPHPGLPGHGGGHYGPPGPPPSPPPSDLVIQREGSS